MGTKTRSILWCLAFLAVAELGVRALDLGGLGADGFDMSTERPVVFLVGGSRTRRALVPAVIEQALADAGVEGAFVANVHRGGITQVGEHQLYMEEVHPHVRASRIAAGFVGIELRAAALNDSFLRKVERAYVAERASEAAADRLANPAARTDPAGVGAALEGRGVEGLASDLLGRLALARGRDEVVRPLLRRMAPVDQIDAVSTGGDVRAGLAAEGVTWAAGDQGWEAFERPRRDDLDADTMRSRYVGRYLRAFEVGGVQLDHVRRLVDQVRVDGLRPFLYVLPITEVHRVFFGDGEYAAFRAAVERLAREEAVPLFDLDRDHDWPPESFHDTHHVRSEVAPEVSRELVQRALLPLLRDG